MEAFDELTQRAIDGDRAALETLLERHLPELRAFVRLRAGRAVLRRDAESDLVQSVCREILTNADDFQHANEGAFKRWLFTTALRKILHRREHHLADRRDVLREEAFPSSGAGGQALLHIYSRFSSPSGHAEVQDEIERIETAMATLTEEQREVITLAHIVGLSRQEIGETIGKSEGAVRATLFRAMATLAVALGAE